jgi:arylsulfate sulfotransferase
VPPKHHWLVVPCLFVVCTCGCSSTSDVPVAVSLSPQTSTILFPGQSVAFTASDSLGDDDVNWDAAELTGGMSSVRIDSSGTFTAPQVSQNTNFVVAIASRENPKASATVVVTVLAPGHVNATRNPQVAVYTLTPAPGTSVYVQFGTDTSYHLKTWAQPAPADGGSVSIFVAGMLAQTEYHMRAAVIAADGTQSFDLDHTFTTQSIPAAHVPLVSVTTTAGATPQPGIEMVDLTGTSTAFPLAAFDLSGNLIWSYSPSDSVGSSVQGVHLLPNGQFLICISPGSSTTLLHGPIPGATTDVLREIDLAGNTIREESLDALNASLSSAGFSLTAITFHHDVIALPNGHWIALVNIEQPCSGRAVCASNPNILGDVLVDLAPQPNGKFLPVWVWNSFDHLDVTRAPMSVADWTHSNAILYSPDDGNLLLSVRHQNWILKIDYNNGQGTGNVLWRLGYQGDFTLVGGTDPTDWFYAQHGHSFATANTTVKFSLVVMDNGNDRVFSPDVTCGVGAAPPCLYSSALLLQIDEDAVTATIERQYLPNDFSGWGGNGQLLPNGNLEADFNAGAPGGFSDIFEVAPGTTPEVIWHLRTSAQNAYRGFRMRSLYPGVQW